MPEHPDDVAEPLAADAPAPADAEPASGGTVAPEGSPDVEPDTTADADPVELPPRLLGLVAGVGLVALLVDQLTKAWALSALGDGRIIDVVWTLRFNLAYNTGAAFSAGSGKGIGPWITVLAIGVVVVVALGATSRTRLGAIAAGLIAGGALGNLADRAFRGDDGLLHGAVIDFIDLQWWPIWNIADACVVVGACLLVLVSLRMPQ